MARPGIDQHVSHQVDVDRIWGKAAELIQTVRKPLHARILRARAALDRPAGGRRHVRDAAPLLDLAVPDHEGRAREEAGAAAAGARTGTLRETEGCGREAAGGRRLDEPCAAW